MGKGKGDIFTISAKWMVIVIVFFISLGGHSGVSHNNIDVIRDFQVKFMGRQRLFMDFHMPISVIGNAGGIGASFFTCNGKFSK